MCTSASDAHVPARSDAPRASAAPSLFHLFPAQQRLWLWLQFVFAFRLVVGQAPRLPAAENTATGAIALQAERNCDCVRLRAAEREREGSAAKLTQRMNARPADRWLVKEAAQRANSVARERPAVWENLCRRNSRRRVPNSSVLQRRLRANFCSTVLASIGVAFRAWNETGRRRAAAQTIQPPQQTHNDLRSQSRKKLRSRRLRSARSFSLYCIYSHCSHELKRFPVNR